MQSRQLLFGIGITLARGLIHPRPEGAGFSLPLTHDFITQEINISSSLELLPTIHLYGPENLGNYEIVEKLKPVIFAADTGGYYGVGKFIEGAYLL